MLVKLLRLTIKLRWLFLCLEINTIAEVNLNVTQNYNRNKADHYLLFLYSSCVLRSAIKIALTGLKRSKGKEKRSKFDNFKFLGNFPFNK